RYDLAVIDHHQVAQAVIKINLIHLIRSVHLEKGAQRGGRMNGHPPFGCTGLAAYWVALRRK
ncbi:hypothetical protein ACOYHI_32400, partial [Pseudomonas aeruginosa]|uniref:hypothetical protein n=1 Tax=Pseudomonas aeruginosa TaxID=287 RepID=UPI003BEECB7B